MTEITARIRQIGGIGLAVDRVVLVILVLLAAITLLTPASLPASLAFVARSLVWIAPFLLLSVAIAGFASASGTDQLIAKVFQGRPLRMIVVAALFGALSPFCSCGVIPIIASLLAAGVPIAPVMAFWVASPLMDPEMFILSSAALGVHFTLAKTIAALGIGLLAGFATHVLSGRGLLDDPLRRTTDTSCAGACGAIATTPMKTDVVWRFWRHPARRRKFRQTAQQNAWFLGKWLTLAFVIESQMVAHLPAEIILSYLSSDQWWTLPAAIIVGIPAYLNGYAAIPLMARLLDMGLAPGAAMAFLLAGGITSVPAAIAVWVLVRPQIFAWYLALAVTGSLAAALVYQTIAV